MSAESADDETVTNVQFQLSLHCVAMTGIWPYQELPDTGSYAGRQFIHVGVAKSERPRLTNGEIIFEEF